MLPFGPTGAWLGGARALLLGIPPADWSHMVASDAGMQPFGPTVVRLGARRDCVRSAAGAGVVIGIHSADWSHMVARAAGMPPFGSTGGSAHDRHPFR